MVDIGLPYRTAIVVGKDNEAARQIGHAGKVTRNVAPSCCYSDRSSSKRHCLHEARTLSCWIQ
jgi:hypothetical protein